MADSRYWNRGYKKGLNRISIRKKGLSNSGKCERKGEKSRGVDVDNCGIVDVHWDKSSR